MSATSKKPSLHKRRKTRAELTKPFDPRLLKKAAALAETYTVIIALEDDYDGPTFFGRTLEMPLVMADGKTREACIQQVLEATTFCIAGMLEDGETPPQPATDETRSAQVNVRLTAMEKYSLEQAARRAGFRGLSDFMRAAALDKAG